MKPEMRVIGIDDGPFVRHKDKRVLVIGTIFRGGKFIEGVVSTTAAVDGTDATRKIATLVNKNKFRPQLQAILLHGTSVGGFNVIDIKKLHKLTTLPVVVVVREYPDFKKIYDALDNLKFTKRKKIIQKMQKPEKMGEIYVQAEGIAGKELLELLRITTTHALIPEALRVAHIIAAGVVKGESRGRA